VFWTVDNVPEYCIPSNGFNTKMHAFMERVCYVKHAEHGLVPLPPLHLKEEYSREGEKTQYNAIRRCRFHLFAITHNFRRQLVKILRRKHGLLPAASREEFLDTYRGSKRKIYENAYKIYDEQGLTPRDSHIRMMVKDEYLKPGGTPRVISPRTPVYHSQLGPFLKLNEPKIFDGIDELFDPTLQYKTVAKHMDMKQRAKALRSHWECFHDPVVVQLDASRFDQHVNIYLLELEHWIYKQSIEPTNQDGEKLSHLLSKQLHNLFKIRGRNGGKADVEVKGVRMSGDMNTSLGNVLVMCMLMFCFREALPFIFKLLNDGDDCSATMERMHAQEFIEKVGPFFAKFGIDMVVEGVVGLFEQIEFCQARPIHLGGDDWIMAPNPRKRVFSDLVSTKQLQHKSIYDKWIGAVAGCGLAMSPGVPIMQAYYSFLSRIADPWIPSEGDFYWKHSYRKVIFGAKYERVTDQARVSYWLAHGITPLEQKAIEQYYINKPVPSREIVCKMTGQTNDIDVFLDVMLGGYYKRQQYVPHVDSCEYRI
jgi:hypothetical protein